MPSPLTQSVPGGDPREDAQWSVTDMKRIDAVCEEFERSWQAGTPLDIKSLVAREKLVAREDEDAEFSRLLFRELLAVDVEYRVGRGEPLSSQALCEMFPEHKDIVALVCDESLPQAAHDKAVPALLEQHPRYEITGRLGMGGMGTVFSGRHKVLGRDVAIKVIRRDFLTTPGARERFLREARTDRKSVV